MQTFCKQFKTRYICVDVQWIMSVWEVGRRVLLLSLFSVWQASRSVSSFLYRNALLWLFHEEERKLLIIINPDSFFRLHSSSEKIKYACIFPHNSSQTQLFLDPYFPRINCCYRQMFLDRKTLRPSQKQVTMKRTHSTHNGE